jgi:hypothetical protein
VDRPFIQHVVESIVSHGIREIYFILPAVDQAARSMLGDGTRWGAQFHYHVPTGNACDGLKQIAARTPDELVLVAQSDSLPLIKIDPQNGSPKLFCWREKKLQWSGWAVIPASDILRQPARLEPNDLFAALQTNTDSPAPCEEGIKPLSAKSFEDLVEANRRVLGREFPGLLVGGREIQPGVWVSRNVKVHPTAKLKSPAFLGENTRVGAMVEVGPSVSIGKHCMIERDTVVSDSVVFSGSYVGQHLSLKGVVVDRSRLINPRWDAEIEGVDELLLGNVFGAPLHRHFWKFCGRLTAILLLIVSSPVFLAMFLASLLGWIPALRKQQMVKTPTVLDSCRWKMFSLWSFGERQIPTDRAGWLRDLFLCFLPALLSIAAGHMGFAGSRPRTREEAMRSTIFQDVGFLYSHPGFLQNSLFEYDAPEYDASAFEVGNTSWFETVTLLMRYARSTMWTQSVLPATGGPRDEI